MITPLGQRQVLTTAALEAVRQGHEGAVQAQLVVARRQAVVDRMTEAQGEVPEIDGTDDLRLDPNRRQGGGAGGAQEESGTAEESPAEESAVPAEGHLDFLA